MKATIVRANEINSVVLKTGLSEPTLLELFLKKKKS